MSSAYHSEGILLDPTSTQLRSLFASLIKYVPATIPENREHFVGMMESGIFPVAVMEYDEPLLERLHGLKSTGMILPQIIVLLDRCDVEDAVRIMRLGPDDLIFRPVDNRRIISHLTQAFRPAHNLLLRRREDRQKRERLEQHHQWTGARNEMTQRNEERLMDSLFYHLKTGLNQGKGPAVLVGLVQVIEQLPREDDGSVKLDREFLTLLDENARATEHFLGMVEQVSETLSSQPKYEPCSVRDVGELLGQSVDHIQEKAAIRGHMIVNDADLNDRPGSIELDRRLIASCFEEALLNALRFSPPESFVSVIVQTIASTSSAPACMKISFLNTAMAYEGMTGIPESAERQVFEPFFRVHKTVDERYGTLDQGLGLFYMRSILRRMGGECRLNNVRGHIDGTRDYVILEMTLPVK